MYLSETTSTFGVETFVCGSVLPSFRMNNFDDETFGIFKVLSRRSFELGVYLGYGEFSVQISVLFL